MAFLALMATAIPNSPKVYWQNGDDCPERLNPSGTFELNLNNYGAVPSKVQIEGKGEGINFTDTLSMNYLNTFMLPPTQISGGHKGRYYIKATNYSLENISFKVSYKYTKYLINLIPNDRFYSKGKEFSCCYKQSDRYEERYDLVDCEK